MGGFYRFLVGGLGVYEAVDRECPRSDSRRALKPDGSWLPRVGEKFPGAVSFWTEAGLKKYLDSGLQEWHRSVVSLPLSVACAPAIENALYSDELQVICAPSETAQTISWEKFAIAQGAPLVEKVVAYVVSADESQILVFEHDEEYRDAGVQVPAGTVGRDEDFEAAVLRELEEESGIRDASVAGKIDEYLLFRHTHGQFHRRHVYLLRAPLFERKEWIHMVEGEGVDKGMNFHFYWLPAKEARHKLTASFGSSVDRLRMIPLLKMAEEDPNLNGFVEPHAVEKARLPIRDGVGEIVGFATPRQERDGVWRMGAIYVHPEARSKGLGRQAIREFMHKRQGRAFIEHENIASQKAYAAAGFTKKQPDQNGSGHWWENF